MGGSNTGFEIARATGRCAATGAAIEPGQAYVATLCERPDDAGLDRFDFSMPAWEEGRRPERLYSYWKTTMPEPDGKKQPFVDDEVLLNLFHRLGDDDRAERVAYRFVVALILTRKRLLKHDSTARDASKRAVWLMRLKGDPLEAPPVEVVDPGLTEDRLREVSDQLGEILRGDL